MSRSWIGLGANLGRPRATLGRALAELEATEGVRLEAVSPVYRTTPWGRTDQPDFLNAVARVDTVLAPEALLAELLALEARLGRRRDGERWGPRVIDLDLLVHDDTVMESERLTLPHPRLAERAFVLVPLADLDADLDIPGLGRVEHLLRALPGEGSGAVHPAGELARPERVTGASDE